MLRSGLPLGCPIRNPVQLSKKKALHAYPTPTPEPASRAMQCLARAVAQSARTTAAAAAAAAEGYAGRRFLATGRAAVKSSIDRRRLAIVVRARTRSERLYEQRLLSRLRATEAKLDKLEVSSVDDTRRQLYAALAGVLMGEALFEIFKRSIGSRTKKEDSPGNSSLE